MARKALFGHAPKPCRVNRGHKNNHFCQLGVLATLTYPLERTLNSHIIKLSWFSQFPLSLIAVLRCRTLQCTVPPEANACSSRVSLSPSNCYSLSYCSLHRRFTYTAQCALGLSVNCLLVTLPEMPHTEDVTPKRRWAKVQNFDVIPTLVTFRSPSFQTA